MTRWNHRVHIYQIHGERVSESGGYCCKSSVSFSLGTISRPWSQGLRNLLEMHSYESSLMQADASPWRALKVRTTILKWTLNSKGNQWCGEQEVMWQKRLKEDQNYCSRLSVNYSHTIHFCFSLSHRLGLSATSTFHGLTSSTGLGGRSDVNNTIIDLWPRLSCY